MAIPLAAIAAIPALAQTGLGAFQAIKGSRMKPQRPVYQRPQEIDALVDRTQARAGAARFAGQELAEQSADAQAAQFLNRARGTAQDSFSLSSLAAGSALMRSSRQREIDQMALQDRDRRQSAADAALQTAAGFSDKEFDINQQQRFLDESATKSALTGAGIQNLQSGLTGLGSVAATQLLRKQNMKDTNKTTNSTTGTTTSSGSNVSENILLPEQYRGAYDIEKAAGLTGESFEQWLLSKGLMNIA